MSTRTTTANAHEKYDPAAARDLEHASCAPDTGSGEGDSDGSGGSAGESGGRGGRTDRYGKETFGDESGMEIKYRSMSWISCSFVLIAETVSLGILSLPHTLSIVGLVPGIILLLSLGGLATYTGLVLGEFKVRHPGVHSFAEAGGILMGPFGFHLFGMAQLGFLVFVMGAHILSFSIMMNVLTSHGMCTNWFMLIALGISVLFTVPRTLKSVSFLSFLSSGSVLLAVVVCMIGVSAHPPTDMVPIVLFPPEGITLARGFSAVTNIVFAYAGHVAFFTLFSEMSNPKEYWKSIFVLQAVDITLYTVSACVIYSQAGGNVRSPALGSAPTIFAKAAYGIASPTIIIAGVVNAHVAAKYVLVQLCQRPRFASCLHDNGLRGWSLWLSIVIILWILAYFIAEAIPVFGNLLGLISALFLSWFTYGLSGVFWLNMYWDKPWFCSWKRAAHTVTNIACVPIGAAIMVLGLYSSGVAIAGSGGRVFSCADNANI